MHTEESKIFQELNKTKDVQDHWVSVALQGYRAFEKELCSVYNDCTPSDARDIWRTFISNEMAPWTMSRAYYWWVLDNFPELDLDITGLDVGKELGAWYDETVDSKDCEILASKLYKSTEGHRRRVHGLDKYLLDVLYSNMEWNFIAWALMSEM